jgi:hypothetical protein
MRRAVTIGLRHDTGKAVVIVGPDVPLAEHRTRLQELQAAGSHAEFCQVEIWTSDAGIQRRKKFVKPSPVAAEATNPNPTPQASPPENSPAPEQQEPKNARKKK